MPACTGPSPRYSEGIRHAIARGRISFAGGSGVCREQEFFSHLAPAGSCGSLDLRPTNTRPLCAEAEAILHHLARRSGVRVLELGPGAGVAAAAIRRILPSCRLETLSLTPIDPFRTFEQRQDGAVPRLSRVRAQEPYIDQQYIGDVEETLAMIPKGFDFVYDNFGPVFWHLVAGTRRTCAASADRLLAQVCDLLCPDGVLFIGASEGSRRLELLLDQKAGPEDELVLLPPRYENTEIRTCILAKGAAGAAAMTFSQSGA